MYMASEKVPLTGHDVDLNSYLLLFYPLTDRTALKEKGNEVLLHFVWTHSLSQLFIFNLSLWLTHG